MKLLTSTFLAAVAAQSGDYTDYEQAEVDKGFQDYGNKGQSGSSFATGFSFGSGRSSTAVALNCWGANFDTDTDTGALGPIHLRGSDARVNNNGGRYQYGHQSSAGQAANSDFHQSSHHRLPGCIYEVKDWDYDSDNYNGIHKLTYVGTYTPIWQHFFNAHVIPSGGVNPVKLVMANPTYEGLGWLNFVVTYSLDSGVDDYNSFTDDRSGDADPWKGAWTLDLNHEAWHTHATDKKQNWALQGTPAVSSFPNNDLGKDFRFNIRTLHSINGAESYYFYQVSTITVNFPHFVAYALHNDYRSSTDMTADPNVIDGDDVGTPGTGETQGQLTSSGRINIIPPVDQANHYNAPDDNNIAGYLVYETAASAITCDPADDDTCASWCVVPEADKGLERLCSKRLIIEGLLSTYSDHLTPAEQRQKGTLTEIWVQLSYAMNAEATGFFKDTTNHATHDSPHPNLLFVASQMAAGSIEFSCSDARTKTANYATANTCAN